MAPIFAAVVAKLGLTMLAQSVVKRVAVITLQEIGARLKNPAYDAAVVAIAAELGVPIAKRLDKPADGPSAA